MIGQSFSGHSLVLHYHSDANDKHNPIQPPKPYKTKVLHFDFVLFVLTTSIAFNHCSFTTFFVILCFLWPIHFVVANRFQLKHELRYGGYSELCS
jgi:hypothetical protein